MFQKAVPKWLGKQEYPFQNRYFHLPIGAMHYIDEGEGYPAVFLHGNGSWSFEFRNIIKTLSKNCRCIAPDLIGFGLSDKPVNWDYLPESYAHTIETFLNNLSFEKCTFVLSDWGGPIGLSYALRYPEKTQKLLLLNAWCWRLNTNPYSPYKNRRVGTKIVQLLNAHIPFFTRKVIKRLLGNSPEIEKHVHLYYYKPLADRKNRKGYTVFISQLKSSGEWLEMLWNQLQKLRAFPVTIIWGMKDNIFTAESLNQWQSVMPHAKVIWLEKAGHLPQDAAPQIIIKELGWCKKVLKYELMPGGIWKEK